MLITEPVRREKIQGNTMMRACGLFLVAMEVFFYVSDAQIIISDPTSSMVSKTSFYEQVKDELLTQFASVIDEIRTVSLQNRQDVRILTDQVSTLNEIRANNENIYAKITRDAASTQTQLSNVLAKNQQFDSIVDEIRTVSVQNRQDVSNLTVLVSKLENKIRNESEKCFAKVTNDVEIQERKTQKISQLMVNLESRMKARFQEIGSLLNLTDISSEENITGLPSDIRNSQFTVDNDDKALENDLTKKKCRNFFKDGQFVRNNSQSF